MEKRGILIGSDKGGVGKSLFSQLVVGACDLAIEDAFPDRRDRRSMRVKLCEIDHRRRLSTIMPDRVDLSLDPHELAGSGAERGSVIGAQFDPAYDLWVSGNSITDLGANVTTPLFDWMQSGGVLNLAREDQLSFEFVAVASPDDQALRSALEAIRTAKSVLGKTSGIFLVLNDIGTGSGFAPFEKSDVWRDLQRLRDDAGVQTISLPACRSKLMNWAQAKGKTIFQLLENEGGVVDEIVRDAGFGRLQRHREMNEVIDWLTKVQTAMVPMFERFELTKATDDRVVPLEARRAV